EVLSAVLVNLPMHAGSGFVIDLHAIHSAVALSGLGVFGEDERHGYIAPAILGPAFDDRKVEQREIALLEDTFLAGSVADDLGEHTAEVGEPGDHLDFFDQSLGRLDVNKLYNTPGDLRVIVDSKRHQHPLAAAQCVDQDRDGMALHVFEKQGRTAAL